MQFHLFQIVFMASTYGMKSLILSLLLFFVCINSTKADEPDQQLHKKCLYPCVRIENEGSGGSGVIVRSEKVGEQYRNVVITCAHVIHPGSPYKARVPLYEEWSSFEGFEDHPCRVYARNEDVDLAVLLFTSDHEMPVAEFGFHDRLFIGSDIFHIGCGLGPEPRLDYGKVTSLKGFLTNQFKDGVRTSINVVPGDSGGPVYHKYRLVGFIQAIKLFSFRGIPMPVTTISLMIPVERLKTWDAEQNNNLAFIYKSRRRMPELPFAVLRLEECQISKRGE